MNMIVTHAASSQSVKSAYALRPARAAGMAAVFVGLVLALLCFSPATSYAGEQDMKEGLRVLASAYTPSEYRATGYAFTKDFEGASAYYSAIKSQASKLVAGKKTARDKARAIYDWIIYNVTHQDNDNYTGLPHEVGANPYWVWRDRTAVCYGFSQLSQLMLQHVGIPCVVVRGYSWWSSHVWNAVFIDGEWFYWDAALSFDKNNPPSEESLYAYFLFNATQKSDSLASYTISFIEDFRGDSCYYPVHVSKAHVVTLNAQGGTCATSKIAISEDESLNGGKYRRLPVPTRAGATFGGWFSSPTGGKQLAEDTPSFIRSDTTLYARWMYNIEEATVRKIPNQTYTGNAIEPKPQITYKGTKLVEGKDYRLHYLHHWHVGTGYITIEGMGNYFGSFMTTFTIVNPPAPSTPSNPGTPAPAPQPKETDAIWKRLAGDTAYGTMRKVVAQGWNDSSASTVVIANFDGYWDALSASSLAGMYDAPILLTGATALAPACKAEIARLKASRAIIVGGPAVVSDACAKQVKQALVGQARVDRVWGGNAQETAVAVAKKLNTRSSTCIVATSSGYWDALSASPYAYRFQSPIYLTDDKGVLSPATLKAIKDGGHKRVIIVGGRAAVAARTESDLKKAGVGEVDRKWGDNAIITSHAFASFALSDGMSANHMGVATVTGHWDALTGGALCGRKGGVLVLASADNTSNTTLPRLNRKWISRAYILGGTAVLPTSVFSAFAASTRGAQNLRV